MYERQAVVIGESCQRYDSGIWRLEQARLNCQAEGRFTAAEQKALETGSCLHIQCAGDSSAYTNMKDSEENEKDRGSSFTTCPTLRPKCTKLFFEAQALQEPNPCVNHCWFCKSLVLPPKSQQNILNIESPCALMKINHSPFFRCCGHSGL